VGKRSIAQPIPGRFIAHGVAQHVAALFWDDFESFRLGRIKGSVAGSWSGWRSLQTDR
jgi:hypothetical protein